jgi:hypothetical protein
LSDRSAVIIPLSLTHNSHGSRSDRARVAPGRFSALADRPHHQGVERLVAIADWLGWVFSRAPPRRARSAENRALRALAALGDGELANLSEAGQHLRRRALQQIRTSGTDGPLRSAGL